MTEVHASALEIQVGGRATGKTARLIEWVLDGTPTKGYPGWTRVMVVPTMEQLMWLREKVPKMAGDGNIEWGDIDFDHRFYTHRDWRQVPSAQPDTEVVVDNADWLLTGRNLPGRLVRVTMRGEVSEVAASLRAAPMPLRESTLDLDEWLEAYDRWWHLHASEEALRS